MQAKTQARFVLYHVRVHICVLFFNNDQRRVCQRVAIITLAYPNSITTPLLQAAEFIINTDYCILICSACQEVVDPDSFRTHIVQKHKNLAAPSNLQMKLDYMICKQWVYECKNIQQTLFPVELSESTLPPALTRWEKFQKQIQGLPPCSPDASHTDNYRILRQILHKER
jgi:Orsellinic acid/F9775 biosynthesis cluster protein D